MALVFYGTEQSKNPRNSFKHVYVYHDLNEPGKMQFFKQTHNYTLFCHCFVSNTNVGNLLICSSFSSFFLYFRPKLKKSRAKLQSILVHTSSVVCKLLNISFLYPCLSLLLWTGAKRVQEVDALRGEKGAKLAAETIGSGETSLGDALWCCANLYSDIKLRLSHKRLMIFTCRDEPHGGDSVKDRQARTKASDLKETGGSERSYSCKPF